MVLVDPTHEDMYWEINGRIVVPRLLTDSEWATMKPKGLSPRGERPAPKLIPPFDRPPSDVQTLRRWLMSLPLSESQIAGGDVRDMRQHLAQVYPLTRGKDGGYRVGDIALVVLTKATTGPAGPLRPQELKSSDQLADELGPSAGAIL